MRVGELCNREVVVVTEECSIADATEIMREYHVGDVLVVNESEGRQKPVGILTDRDVALGIVARKVDPSTVNVGDAMTFDLETVSEDADLLHVIEVMREKGIRRIPVVDSDEALVGIVTVDDLIDLMSEIMVDLAHLVDSQRRREQKRRP